MAGIRVVTDSAADIPANLVAKHDIRSSPSTSDWATGDPTR